MGRRERSAFIREGITSGTFGDVTNITKNSKNTKGLEPILVFWFEPFSALRSGRRSEPYRCGSP